MDLCWLEVGKDAKNLQRCFQNESHHSFFSVVLAVVALIVLMSKLRTSSIQFDYGMISHQNSESAISAAASWKVLFSHLYSHNWWMATWEYHQYINIQTVSNKIERGRNIQVSKASNWTIRVVINSLKSKEFSVAWSAQDGQ